MVITKSGLISLFLFEIFTCLIFIIQCEQLVETDNYYAVLGDNEETYIQPRYTSGRVKRTLPDSDEINTLVNSHNTYRSTRGASDMELLVSTILELQKKSSI